MTNPAFRFDPSALAPAVANRVLDREAWAQASLAAHGGKIFAVVVGPVASTMRIDTEGRIERASPSGVAPDLTLRLSPFQVPSFLAEPARWSEFIVADGDDALAATLKGLAETMPWLVERALAESLGPVIGQRIADTGRRLLALPEYARRRIGESVVSYARDEAKLAAQAAETRVFGAKVAETATAVDVLAQRVAALAARLALTHSVPTTR